MNKDGPQISQIDTDKKENKLERSLFESNIQTCVYL
jgi:hypothetical protein